MSKNTSVYKNTHWSSSHEMYALQIFTSVDECDELFETTLRDIQAEINQNVSFIRSNHLLALFLHFRITPSKRDMNGEILFS